jgi:DNA-cytosine methyltransferase
MKYLSVFSGIEAATVAWKDLGWELVGLSEIEPFPCSVLKHHYPDVKNYGDINNYKEWNIERGSIDLIVGGSPCQAFSTAGLRRGLEDPRGNLTLVFLGLIDHLKPQWVVWENVPGVISDKTDALGAFLDGLEELGYCVDIDVLNAEHYGVPQRRRRVYLCAERADIITRSKTHTSLLTTAQCMLEILQSTLALQKGQSGDAPLPLASSDRIKDGLQRRMKLFGLLGNDLNNKCQLPKNLEEMQRNLPNEQKNLVALLGEENSLFVTEDLASHWKMETSSLNTDTLLRKYLEDLLHQATLFTTSTLTNSITTRQTYMYLVASLLIANAIHNLNTSCPNYSDVESLSLTVLMEYIDYARQTNNSLFGEPEWICAVDFAIERATNTIELIRHSAGYIDRRQKILSLQEGMCGNPKKGRTKRARIAPTPKRGTVVGDCEGRVGNPTLTCSNLANINNQSFLVGEKVVPFRKSSRAQTKDGLETWVEDEVSNTVNCFDVGDVRSTNLSVHLYENHPNDSRIKELHDVCSTVTSRWGTGGGNVPLVGHEEKVVYSVREDAKANNFSVNERTVMNALQAMRPAVSSHHAQNFIVHRPTDNIANTIGCGNHLTPEDVVIVEPLAFEPGSVARNAGPAGLSEQCPTLRANMGDNQPAVVYTMPIQDTRDVQKSQNGLGVGDVGSPAYTVDTHATQGVAQVFAFNHQSAGDMRGVNLKTTAQLQACQQTSVLYNMIVRRLTPVESLRLQGFPDDYLDVLHNNRTPGDNAVFKAIGNSMATPVVGWVGKRIQASIDRRLDK